MNRRINSKSKLSIEDKMKREIVLGNKLVTMPIWKLKEILNEQFSTEYYAILEGKNHIEFDNFGTYDVLKNVYYGEDMIIYE